ncbi:hypothetical protein Tco_1556082 [Tanacetum coccineum]
MMAFLSTKLCLFKQAYSKPRSGSYSSYTTSSSKATPTATPGLADEVIHSFLATNADDVDLIHEDLDQKRRPRVDGKPALTEGKRSDFKPVQIEKEALMTIDEGQINWVEQTTDEELNHALMAFTVNNEMKLKKYRRIAMKAVKEKDVYQKIVDSWFASYKKSLEAYMIVGWSSTVKWKDIMISHFTADSNRNQFTPRPVNVRPNLSTAGNTIKTGRVNVNTGHENVNAGSVHVNAGTQVKCLVLLDFNTWQAKCYISALDHHWKHMEHYRYFDMWMFWAHGNAEEAKSTCGSLIILEKRPISEKHCYNEDSLSIEASSTPISSLLMTLWSLEKCLMHCFEALRDLVLQKHLPVLNPVNTGSGLSLFFIDDDWKLSDFFIITDESNSWRIPNTPVQTRSSLKKITEAHALVSYIQAQQRSNHKDHQHCLFACFLSQFEPRKVSEALEDGSWVEGSSCMITKQGSVAQGHRKEERIEYDEVFAPMHRYRGNQRVKSFVGIVHQAPRACVCDDIIFGFSTTVFGCDEFEALCKSRFHMRLIGEITFFLGLQVKQNKEAYSISQTNQDAFDQRMRKLLMLMLHLYRSLIGLSLDLEAFYDSDFGGSNLVRKSTTGGCQFLGQSFISLAMYETGPLVRPHSTTEAEYVSAAILPCGASVWRSQSIVGLWYYLELERMMQDQLGHGKGMPSLSIDNGCTLVDKTLGKAILTADRSKKDSKGEKEKIPMTEEDLKPKLSIKEIKRASRTLADLEGTQRLQATMELKHQRQFDH